MVRGIHFGDVGKVFASVVVTSERRCKLFTTGGKVCNFSSSPAWQAIFLGPDLDMRYTGWRGSSHVEWSGQPQTVGIPSHASVGVYVFLKQKTRNSAKRQRRHEREGW